jgi:transcriptional regulator with XRE-family HTH domain
MTGRSPRRTDLAIIADTDAAAIRTTIGAAVRESRVRRSWSQADLGERVSLTRQVVSRIESGDANVRLEDLVRATHAIGRPATFTLRRDPVGEAADAPHLAMQELVLRTALRAGFDRTFELPVGPEPWRSIDVGLSSERLRACLAVECWNALGNIGAAARSSNRKLAEMSAMAVARWGVEGVGGLVWVVRATAANRALVARYPEVFASRFPGSSRGWLATLTRGAQPPTEPGLVWCDVGATRLFAWRRP